MKKSQDEVEWSSSSSVEKKYDVRFTVQHQSTSPNCESKQAGPSASSSKSDSHQNGAPLNVLRDADFFTKPAALVTPAIKHYGPRMRLYCRTGYTLMIFTDGKVLSDELGEHPAGVLEFSSAGWGEVRIRGVEANLYLAMNHLGNLYGEEDPRKYSTVFVEGTYGQYSTYLSQKYAHAGWYVGIKKNGMIKRGPLTKWGQKAIQFIPVRT